MKAPIISMELSKAITDAAYNYLHGLHGPKAVMSGTVFMYLWYLMIFLRMGEMRKVRDHRGWTEFFSDPKINHSAMISRHGYTMHERRPEHRRLLRSFDCKGFGCDKQPIDWDGIKWRRLVKNGKCWVLEIGNYRLLWPQFNVDGTSREKRRGTFK